MKKGQSMKYKRKLLGAEEVERLVREVEDFAEREGRMPSGKAPDEAERALRSRYDYLTRPSKSHLLSDGQRARLESARTLYRRKAAELDLDEEARFAVRYADERGEMPHQSDSDPRVRRCAFALSYSDNINRLSPSLRAELVEARKVCGVYAYEDTLELVDDYVSFVELEGREPDPRSPALGERRLVHALRRRKGEMDDEQLRRVCGARDSVCRRGQTSFSEKLLAEGIRSAMTSGDFIGCNVTLEGRETDILVSRADGGRVCVQYDGAIHRGALSAERDHSADATMAALGMAVVRAREPGCEPYAETPEAVPVMLAAPLLERDDAGLASEVLRVAAAAGLDVDVSGVDWGGGEAQGGLGVAGRGGERGGRGGIPLSLPHGREGQAFRRDEEGQGQDGDALLQGRDWRAGCSCARACRGGAGSDDSDVVQVRGLPGKDAGRRRRDAGPGGSPRRPRRGVGRPSGRTARRLRCR